MSIIQLVMTIDREDILGSRIFEKKSFYFRREHPYLKIQTCAIGFDLKFIICFLKFYTGMSGLFISKHCNIT